MKNLIALFVLCVTAGVASAQSNTFPLSGDVGIGTTSPINWFPGRTVEISDIRPILKLNSTAPTGISTLVFTNSTVNTTSHIGEFHINYLFNQANPEKSLIRFDAYPGSSFLSLQATGNVGIGQTNPVYKLDVNGIINATGILINGAPFAGGGSQWATSASNISFTAGNVSIGSSTARGKFDVDGPGNIYLSDDVNSGTTQSIFLPGHIYISPYNGESVSYLQARRLDDSGSTELRIRTYNNGTLTEAMHIQNDGDVGIGTVHPDAKLAVKGDIHTQEVRVDLTGSLTPDYVFEKDYNLLSLSEVEAYINENKHLPEVPSAKEMEANGLNLKEMNLLLLKKVEELTLHLIEKEKKMAALEDRIEQLEKQ